MGAQKLTYVDHNTLHQSFVFLRDTYDSRSGQFDIVGKVIHQEMKVQKFTTMLIALRKIAFIKNKQRLYIKISIITS